MTIYQQYLTGKKQVERAEAAIFLTGNLVKVAVGDFTSPSSQKVREIYTVEVPDGSLSDGRVIDEEAFCARLSHFLTEHRLEKCAFHLAVDSPDFICRVLKLPKANEQKTALYVGRYFGFAERLSDPVYGYIPLVENSQKNERRLFVSAVSRATVVGYTRIFRQLNIRLLSVQSSLLLTVKMLSSLPEISGKTCLVQVTEGRESTGMMFVDGIYQASMRTHLWEPFGSIGFGVEFARINAQLLQNMRNEYPGKEISEIFLCGFREENQAVTVEAIRHMGEVLPISVPDGADYVVADNQTEESPSCFSEYLVTVAAMRFRSKTSEFLHICREARPKKLPNRYRAYIAAALLIVLLFSAFSIGRGMKVRELKSKYEALENEVIALKETAVDYNEILHLVGSYHAKINGIEALLLAMDSFPNPNSAVNDLILTCSTITDEIGNEIEVAEITFNSYTAADGALSITVHTKSSDDINISRFVAKFRELGIFHSVDYTGQKFDEKNNKYLVYIKCTLNENAGKGEGFNEN